LTTPIFQELGISAAALSAIWVAGPVSGLIGQPLAGIFSDRSQLRLGRRRPFLVAGTFFIIVGLLLISNARLIGGESGGIAVAVVGFWLLDFANNAVQGPCRALIVDLAPKQQKLANAMLSAMLCLGSVAGFLLSSQGALLLSFAPWMLTTYRVLFTLSCVILLVCASITALVARERQHVLTITQRAVVNPVRDLPKQLWHAFRAMPKPMIRACIVQFFSWLAYFTWFIYMQSWLSVEVYEGNVDGSAEQQSRYQLGVERGTLALAAQSLVAMASSALMPKLVETIGLKPTYIGALLILAADLGVSGGEMCAEWLLQNTRRRVFGVLVYQHSGMQWRLLLSMVFHGKQRVTTVCAHARIHRVRAANKRGAIITLPFAIVSEVSRGTGMAGSNIGLLNITVVVPQLIISLAAGLVVDATGERLCAIECDLCARLPWVCVCRSSIISVVDGIRRSSCSSTGSAGVDRSVSNDVRTCAWRC
jgi:solute carrier family 45 protein 1/2/4